MLIGSRFLTKWEGNCNYCERILSGTDFTYKIKSIILENKPEIQVCEQCLFEKVMGKQINIDKKMWAKKLRSDSTPWWRFW